MIDEIKKSLEEGTEKGFKSLQTQLQRIRTGRASAHVLDNVKVDYYGTATPVAQVGQISTPEARLLQIQPFDKTLIPEIEKAILAANLGVTPANDGNIIRIPFPALTEEKRKALVKEVRKEGEAAKIVLRNLRRDENEKVKKAEKEKAITEDDMKRLQESIQEITDASVKKVDEIINAKEKELMTV